MTQGTAGLERGAPARTRGGLHGLVAGTPVYAQDGVLPVEYLTPGDRIITRDAGLATLLAVRVRHLSAARVRVARGAFGSGRPGSDILLPGGQRVLLRDWRAQALHGRAQVLVPVTRLVDGVRVTPVGTAAARLFTLVFERPHLIYADGLELASAAAGADAPP